MELIKLNDIKQKELVAGYKVRFVHSQNMTLAYWDIKAGAELPVHSHSQEQVASIIKGEFEFKVGKKTQIVGADSVVVIPSYKKHSGKAITDCKIIDVFYPTREDYR